MASKTIKTFDIGEVEEPVKFKVGDDEYTAIPANRLPAGALAKYFSAINDNRVFDAHEELFKVVLTEESNTLFLDRLYSVEKPITIGVLGDIAAWLLGEVYMQGEASEESKQS